MSIIDNYNRIKESVSETAIKCNRSPDDIIIITVSKTFNAQILQEAINSGIKIFGENKIQEIKNKIPLLRGEFEVHMIGHLQSNKAREAVNLFSLIHSIDKLSTADKLNTEAKKIHKIQKILLQFKTTDKISQSGATLDELLKLAEAIQYMNNLKIKGLMNIAPAIQNNHSIRRSFAETAEALAIINNRLGLELSELSMGMSGDYKTAIQEGATMIRIGSAIFGERSYI